MPMSLMQRAHRNKAQQAIRFDLLSADLACLMQAELTKPKPDIQRVEILWLLLLGGRRATAPPLGREAPFNHYLDGNLRNILFCDASNPRPWEEAVPFYNFGRWQIHTEAKVYVSQVLWRRTLRLATRSGNDPTNPHKLLQSLCRLSATQGFWDKTFIERDLQGIPQGIEVTWFRPTAQTLQTLVEEKKSGNEGSAAISLNRTNNFGAYWLKVANCAAKLNDELSIGEILTIVPKPLKAGFAGDAEFKDKFQAVIEGLNKCYNALRSCGLPPAEWLDRWEECRLSFIKLKALARLREAFQTLLDQTQQQHNANKLAGEIVGDWEAKPAEREKLFRQAFAEQAAGRKIAGFASYDALASSLVGQTLLERSGVYPRTIEWIGELYSSSDDEPQKDAEEEEYSEIIQRDDDTYSGADNGYEETKTKTIAETLPSIEQVREDLGFNLQDPVLDAFLCALLQGRSFADPGGLYHDTSFQALVAQDSRYSGLDSDSLGERLRAVAIKLEDDNLAEIDRQDELYELHLALEQRSGELNPLIVAYLRWVIMDENLVFGPDGLLSQPDFQAELAKNTSLSHLAPPQLSEYLRRNALEARKQLLMHSKTA